MITEYELLESVPNQLFIGGEWVDAAAGETPGRRFFVGIV